MSKSPTPGSINLKDLTPGYLTHPGEMLKDELEARDMSQADMAKLLDMSRSQLNEHIHGKRDFNTELCLLVSRALQMNEEIWLNLKRNFEVDKVKMARGTWEKLKAVEDRARNRQTLPD